MQSRPYKLMHRHLKEIIFSYFSSKSKKTVSFNYGGKDKLGSTRGFLGTIFALSAILVYAC